MKALTGLRAPSSAARHAAPWVLAGGFVAGTLDLAFAMAWWSWRDTAPIEVAQSVAAWVIGREAAYSGGGTTAVLGTLLHYYLMTMIVAAFHAAAPRWRSLLQRPLFWGALYGALCFVLIHVIAVPMFSAAPPRRFVPEWSAACLLAHMLLVGVPSALFALGWHGRAPR